MTRDELLDLVEKIGATLEAEGTDPVKIHTDEGRKFFALIPDSIVDRIKSRSPLEVYAGMRIGNGEYSFVFRGELAFDFSTRQPYRLMEIWTSGKGTLVVNVHMLEMGTIDLDSPHAQIRIDALFEWFLSKETTSPCPSRSSKATLAQPG